MATARVHVSSPDTFSERSYATDLLVGQLKVKLEPVTGIPADSQILTLCRSETDHEVVQQLSDDARPLDFYGVENKMLIKVSDKDPSRAAGGLYTDVSQVEKFEISKDEYAKRQDTVLAYKKAHHMGRFAPSEPSPSTPPPAPSHHITVGSRCAVKLGGDDGLEKRGTVRFVGTTTFGKGGEWIGVEYDEPVGKNDGSVQGERYFTCKPNYGGFVKADKVTVGDFPVEDFDVEEM